MTWRNLLFAHWAIDPAQLRPILPPGVELDTFDNTAWVAIVPFKMADTSFRGVPNLPGLSDFYECNVRTYVRYQGLPAVWFLSLDAATRLPVLGGRLLWSLNYIHSRFQVTPRNTATPRNPTGFDYALQRRSGPWPPAALSISWQVGDPLPTATPGSLEHFLTERYWLLTHRRGKVLAGRIAHDPWPLRAATITHLDDTLLSAAGLTAIGDPIAHASDSLDVLGWNLQDPLKAPHDG